MSETFANTNQTDPFIATFSAKRRTRFGAWNVRTLSEPSRLDQLIQEFTRYKLEILGLSEVRWPGQGEFRASEGHSLLYSGRLESESRESGVGFLLSNSARKSLLHWEAVDDRIIWIRLRTRFRNLTMIQCYAPTDTSPVENKDRFYVTLYNIMNKVNKGDITIVLGDFNAKAGSSNAFLEDIMGKHGLGDRNENGELFVDFCQSYNLVVGGTLFPHRNIHKVTWVSPDGHTENQIDHITICKKWRRSLLDVRNRRGADMASDHYLVLGEFRLKLASTSSHTPRAFRKVFNLEKLNFPPVLTKYRKTIQEELNCQPITNDVNNVAQAWASASTTICNTAEKLLGLKSRQRKAWISDETWFSINERKDLKQKLLGAKTTLEKETLSAQYRTKNLETKRNARRDKRKWVDSLAESAEEAAQSRNVRKLYSITRQLSNKTISTNVPIKSEDGKTLLCVDDQLARWAQHFCSFLSTSPPATAIQTSTPCRTLRINTDTPRAEEIELAIGKLNSNRAPGADDVVADLLKAESSLFASKLQPLIATIWSTETIPDIWKEGLIIKLPKKGNLQHCRNWRGITLLNSIVKVISQIVLSRIEDKLEKKLRQEQAGFRPGRSCIDHINTLRIIIEQSIEWQAPLYVVFIDFQQAFDRVSQEALWQVLSSIGIPQKITNIIKELYHNSSASVVHSGKRSQSFLIRNGVKQGCLLSPLLFNTLLDWVLKTALNEQLGIQWGLRNRLEDLSYADDICLLSHSYEDMQRKLSRITTLGSQVGLTVNISKTKSMRIGTNNTNTFCINDKEVEEVSDFCYLGSIVSKSGGALEDINSRIAKAHNAFGMLNEVWRSTKISKTTKLRIFNTNVKSILLYGCETWKTTNIITNKLQVFVNKCLRRIMRITCYDRVRNEDLWQMTFQNPVINDIKVRKWNWIGHTLRKEPQDIARTALDWNPQGSRRRGRPATTWRRSMLKELDTHNTTWRQVKRLALNRTRWREFVKALCSPVEL